MVEVGGRGKVVERAEDVGEIVEREGRVVRVGVVEEGEGLEHGGILDRGSCVVENGRE